MAKSSGEDHPNQGNLSVLTKVDKLRELIGARVALPQVVVVGDQSSGKSSVLENLTGFAFPRGTELCTRYATQITCRRETEEGITVSIIANQEASAKSRACVEKFHRTLKQLSSKDLTQLFKDVNKAMEINGDTISVSPDGVPLSAFSEHILKIEKLGPKEQHFTVIDVPGIFRRETEGVTVESDIELVMNMVKKYMRDTRTIILAIIPCNVDPATQEILKLAKKVDPTMDRTMAVLTKPDLAIEQATQQIVINHVLGKRGELNLGYFIVKNRGPDAADKTLEQGQNEERQFFAAPPWSSLVHSGRAGISCLKQRVQELLIDLIRREFPKLKAEVGKELEDLRSRHAQMGPSRSNGHSQRAYLNQISEAFQDCVREGCNGNYTGNKIFSDRGDLRLITRIVEASEHYSNEMMVNGHMRPFANSDDESGKGMQNGIVKSAINKDSIDIEVLGISERSGVDVSMAVRNYPELEEIFDSWERSSTDEDASDIMSYIEEVYKASRGQELGTFGGRLLGTLFKEQSKKWERITLEYMSVIIYHVHRFTSEIIKSICPDPRVHEELWNGYLLDELMVSYRRAMDRARFLLKVECEGNPLTLNSSFSNQLSKVQGDRLVQQISGLGVNAPVEQAPAPDVNAPLATQSNQKAIGYIYLDPLRLQTLAANKANSAQVSEYMHDILSSYYELARGRFVDVIYQQAVNHCLVFGSVSPLQIFDTQMVLGLNEDQLDMIAAEDAPIKQRRDKLHRTSITLKRQSRS